MLDFGRNLIKNQGTIEQDAEKVAPIAPGNVPSQVGASDYSELQDGGEPIPQVHEIQGLLQNKKTSCYGKQNVQEIKKWAVQNSNL